MNGQETTDPMVAVAYDLSVAKITCVQKVFFLINRREGRESPHLDDTPFDYNYNFEFAGAKSTMR